MRKLFGIALLMVAGSLVGPTGSATAQDLEPRAYAASPVGARFVVVAAGRSSGGVVVDPSLPVEDVEATVSSLAVGTGGTLNLFGRTALLVAVIPHVWARATGSVGEEARSISRSGFADPRLKLSVNLVGGRALTAREFAAAQRPTIVGVSLTVAPPLGKYDQTKLINLGSNRWSFKPELGFSRAIRKWTIDGYAGVWLFTENDEYYTGTSVLKQQPVFAVQAHASYTVRPRLWVSMDSTWYSGGRTTVNGVDKANLQRNSRIGFTASFPFARQQSLKVSGSTGATTRFGADFRTIAAAWQITWLN